MGVSVVHVDPGTSLSRSQYIALDEHTITFPAGQATIPFATWLSEDSVAVTGQTDLLADSKIQKSIVADNDDIYAQVWDPPVITNQIAGVGFTIVLRPSVGAFKGAVKINWSWS